MAGTRQMGGTTGWVRNPKEWYTAGYVSTKRGGHPRQYAGVPLKGAMLSGLVAAYQRLTGVQSIPANYFTAFMNGVRAAQDES